MSKKQEAKRKSAEQAELEIAKIREKHETEMIVRNVNMLKSAINVSARLCSLAGYGPEVIMTVMVFVVSDFIESTGEAMQIGTEKYSDMFIGELKRMLDDRDKGKN